MEPIDELADRLALEHGAAAVTPLRHQGADVFAVGGWDGDGLVGDVYRVAGASVKAATAVEANTLRLAARDAAQADTNQEEHDGTTAAGAEGRTALRLPRPGLA